jgi:hypothetical protein
VGSPPKKSAPASSRRLDERVHREPGPVHRISRGDLHAAIGLRHPLLGHQGRLRYLQHPVGEAVQADSPRARVLRIKSVDIQRGCGSVANIAQTLNTGNYTPGWLSLSALSFGSSTSFRGANRAFSITFASFSPAPTFTALTAYPGMAVRPLYRRGGVFRDQLIAAGRQVKVMPRLSVEQGIQAARTIFGKCFFDAEKCADGIQALRHYRYEVEESKSDPAGGHIALSKVPRHDWASHADAFRTAAVMIREPEKKKEQEKRRSFSKLSPWS